MSENAPNEANVNRNPREIISQLSAELPGFKKAFLRTLTPQIIVRKFPQYWEALSNYFQSEAGVEKADPIFIKVKQSCDSLKRQLNDLGNFEQVEELCKQLNIELPDDELQKCINATQDELKSSIRGYLREDFHG